MFPNKSPNMPMPMHTTHLPNPNAVADAKRKKKYNSSMGALKQAASIGPNAGSQQIAIPGGFGGG